MKNLLPTVGMFILVVLSPNIFMAQGINYQAVARDGSGSLLPNQSLNVSFLIREGAANGPVIYDESHTPMTNAYSLFTAVIGEGSPTFGNFSTIDWASNDYFLEVEVGGASVGVTKFYAVPYSKVATGMAMGNLTDVDTTGLAAGNVLKFDGSQWVADVDLAGQSPWTSSGNGIYYSGGRVGIGTPTPSFPLHMTKDTMSINGLEIANLGSANLGLDGDIIPYGGSGLAYDLGNNTTTEHWDDVVAADFITYSDQRLKTQIAGLPVGLKEILSLRPVQYRYNQDITPDGRLRFGLLAQEVEKVFPNIVINEDVDVNPETGEAERTQTEYKSMSYTDLVPVLIQAMQEQQQYIQKLEQRIEQLERKQKK